MKSLTKCLIAAPIILLLSATAAQAMQTTDPEGNTWTYSAGSLAGGEVQEHSSTGTLMNHWPTTMLAVNINVLGPAGSEHVFLPEYGGVKELTPSGTFVRRFDESGDIPNDVAEDPKTHHLYVSENWRVSAFLPDRDFIESFAEGRYYGEGGYECGPNTCRKTGVGETWGVEVNGEGNVTVTERGGNKVTFAKKWTNTEPLR